MLPLLLAQAKLVLSLVRDLPAVTQRILALRALLPSIDLSALLVQYPWCAALSFEGEAVLGCKRRVSQPPGARERSHAPPPRSSCTPHRLLTRLEPEQVGAALDRLTAVLPPNIDAGALVAAEPMLLLANVGAVLAEIERLLPGRDPIAVLLADPSGCLNMQSAGLKASLEIDDGIKP